MGARRTRSGDAQPRSARARNRRGNPGRISTISSTNFFTFYFVADLVVQFALFTGVIVHVFLSVEMT